MLSSSCEEAFNATFEEHLSSRESHVELHCELAVRTRLTDNLSILHFDLIVHSIVAIGGHERALSRMSLLDDDRCRRSEHYLRFGFLWCGRATTFVS